jgi:hypothetical protein
LLLCPLLLSACATMWSRREYVMREFNARRVTRVVLRASAADSASASTVIRDAPFLTVSGVPTRDAGDYHSPIPHRREKPASEWGLRFVARRFGNTLVISSKNEIGHFHHRYTLEHILVLAPHPVHFVQEVRRLTGDGAPDLSPPRTTR